MDESKNPENIIKDIKNEENIRLYLLDAVDSLGLEQYILDTYKEIEKEFPEMVEYVNLNPKISTQSNKNIK